MFFNSFRVSIMLLTLAVSSAAWGQAPPPPPPPGNQATPPAVTVPTPAALAAQGAALIQQTTAFVDACSGQPSGSCQDWQKKLKGQIYGAAAWANAQMKKQLDELAKKVDAVPTAIQTVLKPRFDKLDKDHKGLGKKSDAIKAQIEAMDKFLKANLIPTGCAGQAKVFNEAKKAGVNDATSMKPLIMAVSWCIRNSAPDIGAIAMKMVDEGMGGTLPTVNGPIVFDNGSDPFAQPAKSKAYPYWIAAPLGAGAGLMTWAILYSETDLDQQGQVISSVSAAVVTAGLSLLISAVTD